MTQIMTQTLLSEQIFNELSKGWPFLYHISNDKPTNLLANNAQDQALDENVAVKVGNDPTCCLLQRC